MSKKMSTIDRLRAANNNTLNEELNRPTVVTEDAEEIVQYFGLEESEKSDNEPEKQAETAVASHIKEDSEALKTAGEKRTVGRPRKRAENEIYAQVHINLPESLKDKVQKASICHKTSVNSYIISLIEKDININGKDYDTIFNAMKRFT